MSNKITIDDIARLSNVAKSTVSRYLNNGSIKSETREKIAKVIEQYNYEPNTFARLKAKHSKMIGIVTPCLDSIVTSRVLMSIDETLRKINYTPLIMNTNHDEKLELQYLERLWKMNVDGLVLSATHISNSHKELLNRISIPVVVYAQNFEDGICIVNDDYNGGKFIGEYIGKRGLKRVAYIGVDESDTAIGIIRKNGILDGLKEYGINEVISEMSDFSYIKAQKAVNNILKNNKVDVIICATDKQALGAYKVLRQQNLSIPNDVSVISFGGYDIDELLEPKLTSIRFDSIQGGICCAETILSMIERKKVKKIQYINYEFIEGESVKS